MSEKPLNLAEETKLNNLLVKLKSDRQRVKSDLANLQEKINQTKKELQANESLKNELGLLRCRHITRSEKRNKEWRCPAKAKKDGKCLIHFGKPDLKIRRY